MIALYGPDYRIIAHLLRDGKPVSPQDWAAYRNMVERFVAYFTDFDDGEFTRADFLRECGLPGLI